MSSIMTRFGSWMPHMVPGYWFILGTALLHWAWHALRRQNAKTGVVVLPRPWAGRRAA